MIPKDFTRFPSRPRAAPARERQKSRRRGEDTTTAPQAYADYLRVPSLTYEDDALDNLDWLKSQRPLGNVPWLTALR